MNVGERMLHYRAKHNLSQKKFAEVIGVGVQVVYRAESMKYKMHRVNEIKLMNKMDELEGVKNV
jgi:transcriptional regulator with XRE-family HTH domain